MEKQGGREGGVREGAEMEEVIKGGEDRMCR